MSHSDCSTPGLPVHTTSLSLLKFMSIESVMPSNHLILCHPLLLQPLVFPSIRVFSNESVLRIRWSKYWSFSFSLSNEYSELISFRIDWFDWALLTTPKPLTVWITINCGKFWKRWEYQTTWAPCWEIGMQVKKQQLELDMEQQTSSRWGKEYIKAVYCHPVYLTYMQSTSWERWAWRSTSWNQDC